MIKNDGKEEEFVPLQELEKEKKKVTFESNVVEEQKEIFPTMETQVNLKKEPETDGVIPVSEGNSRKIEDEFINLETTGLRRSPRSKKGGPFPKGCFYSKIFTVVHMLVFILYAHINQELTHTTKSMNHLQALNTYFDGTINYTHNYVMTTLKNSDNDVYTYKNMLE